MKEVMKDIFSDFLGGSGITTISIPFLVEVNDVVKLICTIAGGILVYVSIRYKIALYKDLKRRQKEERETTEHFKK